MSNGSEYTYKESVWYTPVQVVCLACDICLLPYIMMHTWNKSFPKLHDSIHTINWETAFILRICIMCFQSIFCGTFFDLQKWRRFEHFANYMYRVELAKSAFGISTKS